MSLPPARMSNCGNGRLDEGERCDGQLGLPGEHVSCFPDGSPHACDWDFGEIEQLYCLGTCSWAGPNDCDQEDADVFCRLKTGDPNARAVTYQTSVPLPVAGFACTLDGYGKVLGPIPEYGVDRDVHYQDTSLLENHGQGQVIYQVECR